MNSSIYAANVMTVEEGKYANKEPLFASAVTRLYLGEQSLLLLSFQSLLTLLVLH